MDTVYNFVGLSYSPVSYTHLIFDSYACRKGKGTHKAADRLQYWLRQTERKPERYYYVKMDISKYFYRVDHDILLKFLARRIKDQRLLNLLEKITNCESMNFGLSPDVYKRQEIPKGSVAVLKKCTVTFGGVEDE